MIFEFDSEEIDLIHEALNKRASYFRSKIAKIESGGYGERVYTGKSLGTYNQKLDDIENLLLTISENSH